MATSTQESTVDRPIALAMRRDLQVRPLRFGGDRSWGIKDPISLRYFQFREEEYWILQSLDGRTSPAQIKGRFEQQFAPRKLEFGQLQGFLGLLHQQGLVLAHAEGQGNRLLERCRQERRRALASALANPLAIRFRGLDPEWLLNVLYPACRWLFTPWGAALWALLAGSAVLLLSVQFDLLRARVPELNSLFHPQNMVWLAAALVAAKVLHELAHGLTCKHYGGSCHEMGLMLLIFAPCLYCNVTDAWVLPSKWQRAAIGAAGVFAEVALASLCTWLWWFSEPGFFNALLLNVMLVCSVSTFVFNGNPLLRFDGYYVLSDLWEVPNLYQRSQAVLLGWLQRWFLGIRHGPPMVAERRPGLLALYALASASYRWLVVIAALWFCHRVLRSYRLDVIGQLLALLVVGGLIASPMWSLAVFLRDASRRRQVRWSRAGWATGLTAAAVVALGLLPLPCRITVPTMLEPRQACRVYVSAPGTLRCAVRPGQPVLQGAVLARLENLELRREIAELTGLRDLQQTRLDNLERRRVGDPSAGEQIPVAQEALSDLQRRLEQRLADEQRLTLSAPVAGTVLPPPMVRRQTLESELPFWAESPLDESNRDAYLETGTLLCLIGDPHQLDALGVLDQADLEFIRVGQRVRLQWNQLPGEFADGEVAELSELDLKAAPPELLATGLLPTREDRLGQRRLIRAYYLARIAMAEETQKLLIAAPGRAKIQVAPRSWAARCYRYLRSVFRFA